MTTSGLDETAEVPNLGRMIVAGVLIAVIAIFAAVAGVVYGITDDVAAGLGIGAFTAAWAGAGFGTMGAAALHTYRTERAESAAERPPLDAIGHREAA